MTAKRLIGILLLYAVACTPLVGAPTDEPTVVSPSETAPALPATAAPDLSQRGVWLPRSPMLTARSEMPAVELDGLIYVPGGFGRTPQGLANGYGPVTAFDAYDPASDTWHPLAPMPEARHHQMLTVYTGLIYAFGGFIDPWITKSNVWVYDPAGNKWTERKPMPAPRTAGAAVTLGDFIYLVGGTTSQAGAILPTWRYDPASDSWHDAAPLAEPREHNAAVVLDGRIYALGGRWTTTLASVEIYNPASDRWSLGAAMQAPRAGFGATVLDGKLYVAGGELIDTLKTLSSVEVFDPALGKWASLPDMPNRLHGVPIVGVDHAVYLIGGSARSADVINWGRVFAFRP